MRLPAGAAVSSLSGVSVTFVVATGWSLSGATVRATVFESVCAPPLPVLPRSLTVTVSCAPP